MQEVVPVHFVTYQNPENIEYDDEDYSITNHDELDKRYAVRGVYRTVAEKYDFDVIEEGDPMWKEEYKDIEHQEEIDILVE